MAKGDKQEARSAGSERAFRLTGYYKIVAAFTLVVAIAYGALYYARTKGYQLINAPILYWLWFALVIGIILLVGKYIANLPKSESTRRGVRISVGILSIATIFVSYINVVSQIDSGLMKYATLTSPDGAHTAIVMRANITGARDEAGDANRYTIYTAYPRINRFFCDAGGEADIIMLLNDESAALNKEWGDNKLILSTDSQAVQGDNLIEVAFQ